MKKVVGVFLIIILFIAGCNHDLDIVDTQQNEIKELKEKMANLEDTVKQQQEIITELQSDFSYLRDFTEDELTLYEVFLEEKDVQQLSNLSPEKIVLLYFHSVVIDDVESIYLLTYNDGTLPELSIFKDKYYSDGLHTKDLETTLDFRDYNSLEIKDDNSNENEAVVEIGVSYGHFHSVEVRGLKQEDGIWKMDILPLL